MRRGIASQAPKAPAPSKPAGATGAVNKPTPPNAPKATPSDTLKLSKGAVQDKADKAGMEQIAQERAKTEASDRAKELAKNIEELNQLAKVAAKPELPAAPAASTAAADGSNVPAGSASAPSKVVGPAVASGLSTAPAPSWDNLIETAVQDPRISGTLLALVGLLLGFGWFRRRQSVPATNPGRGKWDSAANTSFDTGGGGRVDTADIDAAALTSHVYADSQLEVSHELDPVAEAEVYLAYGKDVPAEEILKEGLQQDPTRVAIHLKLLSIYAKRQDTRSFEVVAKEVSPLVDGSSSEWAQVQEMGKSIDASNPLYGQPGAPASASAPSGTDQSMISFDASASLNAFAESPRTAATAARPSIQTGTGLGKGSETATKTAAKAASDTDFDLTSISLSPTTANPPATSTPNAERLNATLALAEQFIEIDEKEGARALLEEVIAGGNDALRQRAKALLARVQ
jgi:pilus assembly protein FimV